jgi:hypothetical protein
LPHVLPPDAEDNGDGDSDGDGGGVATEEGAKGLPVLDKSIMEPIQDPEQAAGRCTLTPRGPIAERRLPRWYPGGTQVVSTLATIK